LLDIESGVIVICDVRYLSANCSLAWPMCFDLEPMYPTDRHTSNRGQTTL